MFLVWNNSKMHIAISRLNMKRTVKEYIVKEKWNNKKTFD